MDELTYSEELLWEHYNRIEAENHHLKRQLKNKNNIINAMKANYSSLNKKYKEATRNRKPQYKNKARLNK